MNCTCKNLCTTAKFKKEFTTTTKNKNAFVNGFSRCRKCEYYIKGEIYCPCCKTRLATSPRNAKSNRIFKKDYGRY